MSAEDLLSRALDDPYPVYDMVRSRGRLQWIDGLDRWMVTGHRQALEVLRHPKFSSDRSRWDGYELPPGHDRPPGGMFVMDPPDHTRLRSLVQQAFTPRVVERLRPRVHALVETALDAAAERGETDLMADYAGPLPATVLAELLGIPAADQELFRHWTMTLIETIDPVSHHLVSDAGTQAQASLERYLADVIAERRLAPQPDLISSLVAAEEAGERLSGKELRDMCILLTIAGLETSANLIGNGINALLDHPDQAARLRAEPGLITTAVEELLRFDSPIQVSGRVPVEDVEVDGKLLRKGQMVGIMLGGANRDPDAFAEPGRLDLARTPNNHLAFGRGLHFCLGAPLARVEGAIAIAALNSRFPGLSRAGEPKRRHNVHVRGLATLPVKLG
ncbi:Linalool 8-monooxygenase [Actinobacteria bacterium OK074]|nr:Linalool 8-monooxygenase [Actinobacteria bacterium OK074]